MIKIYIKLYKVSWCGYCKSFEPQWEKFVSVLSSEDMTNKLKTQNITIIFDKYDGDLNKEATARANIKYYPTVRVCIDNTDDDNNDDEKNTYDLADHERELNAFADKIFSNNLITPELLNEIKSNFSQPLSGGFFDYVTKPKLKYYNKYLKYKQKYLSLKNKIN